MKNINSILFFTAIILSGCAAHFDRYPGEKLSSFPEEMRGDYFEHNKSWIHYLFNKDSAQISISKDSIKVLNDKGDPIVLNDSNVISKFGNYYALSQLDKGIPGTWNVNIIKFSKNDFEVYPIEENKNYSAKLLELFVSETWVNIPGEMRKRIQSDSLVRPSEMNGNRFKDEKRKKMVFQNETKLRMMKQGSSDTAVVFKMNEVGLKLFFEKYLEKEPHTHLKRIDKK